MYVPIARTFQPLSIRTLWAFKIRSIAQLGISWQTKKSSHLPNPVFRRRIVPIRPLIISTRVTKAMNKVTGSSMWTCLRNRRWNACILCERFWANFLKSKVLLLWQICFICWIKTGNFLGKLQSLGTLYLDLMYSPHMAAFHFVKATNSHDI